MEWVSQKSHSMWITKWYELKTKVHELMSKSTFELEQNTFMIVLEFMEQLDQKYKGD
jgi:hypothetical protein